MNELSYYNPIFVHEKPVQTVISNEVKARLDVKTILFFKNTPKGNLQEKRWNKIKEHRSKAHIPYNLQFIAPISNIQVSEVDHLLTSTEAFKLTLDFCDKKDWLNARLHLELFNNCYKVSPCHLLTYALILIRIGSFSLAFESLKQIRTMIHPDNHADMFFLSMLQARIYAIVGQKTGDRASVVNEIKLAKEYYNQASQISSRLVNIHGTLDYELENYIEDMNGYVSPYILRLF